MNVYVRELARHLGALGIEVDIFTRAHPQCDEVVHLGSPDASGRVIHLPVARGLSRTAVFPYLPRFCAQVDAFAQRHGLRYELVHSHYWLSGWAGRRLARNWRVPHVVTFHTLAEVKIRVRVGEREPVLRRQTEGTVARSAQGIIVSTAEEKDLLLRYYGASAERISVVPCGVDLSLFRPLDARQARAELGLNGATVLLYVGRLDPLKGTDLLLETVARLEASNWLLYVVGGESGGAELARLQAKAGELGISPRVRFTGAVPQDKLPLFYSAADVCVIPSYYESFGLVALEALACGTPVVASPVGGLRSTVRDGQNGFLIAGHCADAFAERLELLVANPNLRRALGEAGPASVQGFAWPEVARQFLEVYQRVTKVFDGAAVTPLRCARDEFGPGGQP